MTEARLRVTFWNRVWIENGTNDQVRPTLADDFTDWTTRDRAQALGEKLIRDGVWVTVPEDAGACMVGTNGCIEKWQHDKSGCKGTIAPRFETFLVPPARIREVTLETREVANETLGECSARLAIKSDASGPPCPAFVPLADGVGVPCKTCGHVEAQHVVSMPYASLALDAPDTAAGWHEREGG